MVARTASPRAPPTCCDVLISPLASPDSLADARDRGDRRRHEREAEADRREQRRAQDVGQEAAVDGDLREPDQAGATNSRPTAMTGLKPILVTSGETMPATTMIVTASGR